MIGDAGVEPAEQMLPKHPARLGPDPRCSALELDQPLSVFSRALSPEQLAERTPCGDRTRTC